MKIPITIKYIYIIEENIISMHSDKFKTFDSPLFILILFLKPAGY